MIHKCRSRVTLRNEKPVQQKVAQGTISRSKLKGTLKSLTSPSPKGTLKPPSSNYALKPSMSATAAKGMMEDGLHAKGAMEVDDDGRPRRTGTVWTASAHIVTAVIGSGVLSLAWAMAQLGWLVGPVVLIAFSLITYSTSAFLADCYRTSDQVHGGRNYNYMSTVKSHLGMYTYTFTYTLLSYFRRIKYVFQISGKKQIWMCGLCQYINLCGTTVGYTITAGISAAAVIKSHCYHQKGHEADCSVSHTNYMIMFGVAEMVISQLPNFHNISWLSALAAVMSFSYSLIGIGLGIAQVASGVLPSLSFK
ncbi:Amino acid permease 8 [Apostasia shenzhenica]|uniref:Amino acid permease 8 n=1 Tax=Apostasia shenzhenica TaxID=1088818 RepID=A0A2I0AE04_9ASPA|nr:Amino acid permease 8 [Apostasia shenzhenica]